MRGRTAEGADGGGSRVGGEEGVGAEDGGAAAEGEEAGVSVEGGGGEGCVGGGCRQALRRN